jgi:hypothetical protein
VIPWLIEISCCRLFTPTICEMYSVGSVGCVGSWFFISATSNVRKSFAVIVVLPAAAAAALAAELLALPVLVAPLAAPVELAAAALGRASAPATLVAELAIWSELTTC